MIWLVWEVYVVCLHSCLYVAQVRVLESMQEALPPKGAA